MPRVSFLIPAYQAACYVGTAVDSCLAQSYRDIEVLVVDDGSTDGTWKVLERLARRDRRVRIFRNKENQGLAATLNMMIELAKGEFLARLDADDLSLPDRLMRQLHVLEEGGFDLCAAWARTLGTRLTYLLRSPTRPAAVRASLVFANPLIHSTVVLRRSVLGTKRYDPRAGAAEDYDLWVRLAADGAQMAVVPAPLVRYRVHHGQIGRRRAIEQWHDAGRVRRRALRAFGLTANPSEEQTHAELRRPGPSPDEGELQRREAWLLRLSSQLGNSPDIRDTIAAQWFRAALEATVFGPRIAVRYATSPLCEGTGKWRRLAIVTALAACRIAYRSRTYERLAGTISN